MRQIFWNTLLMGVLSSALGTLLGFIFAYAVVRCRMPGQTLGAPAGPGAHRFAALRHRPQHHPALRAQRPDHPEAAGHELRQGTNDIYGMDGLVFVQVITFFTVAYLILRAMLERLNPSMEEAADSLGAGSSTSSAR